jgi:hypothetical protein
MNTKLIRSLTEFIRAEEDSRESLRASMSAEAAHCQAIFHDAPLTNELYLLVLLFMWHEIEKEIVLMAALSSVQNSSPLTRDDYQKEVEHLGGMRYEKRKIEIERRLPALDARSWDLLDLLRLLANSFKHDPFDKPDHRLLKRLRLPENMNYASMAESGAVRSGLAQFLGIGDEATFSEIVEAVRKSCDRTLFILQTGTPLRSFETERVSLNPQTFER